MRTTSFFNCRVEHRPLLEEVAIQSGARITNVFEPAREQYTNLWWMRIEFEAKDRAQCLRVDDAVRGAKVVLGLLKYTGSSDQEGESTDESVCGDSASGDAGIPGVY